jgi:hypothetical protein
MGKQALMAFFKPNSLTIIAVGSLLLLSAVTQFPWHLDQQNARIFAYFPALVWLVFTAPLLALSWAIFPSFFNPPLVQIFSPVGVLASIIYYYILSCVLVYLYRRLGQAWRLQTIGS